MAHGVWGYANNYGKKIVQTNLKYQRWAKKAYREGVDGNLAWWIACGGMRINMEKNSSNKFEISALGKKAYREGADDGLAWHTERGGMRMILGEKIVQTNLKYQRWAKKHIGKEWMMAWRGTRSVGVCG